MRIVIDESPNFLIVLLNNKHIRTAISADEEEGWVEILDISQMAPLRDVSDKPSEPGLTIGEEVGIKTKKLYGDVRIVDMGPCQKEG